MGNIENMELAMRNAFKEGDEVNGYKFISKLGSGAFGSVWKVEKEGKLLAIKIIPFTDSTGDVERIFADVLKLKSPFLVRYFESFKSDRLTFIVMELCTQGDLGGLVDKLDGDKGIGLQSPRLVKIFTQLVLGLNELHRHKILHRDLKLKNVFVDDEDNVKLGDFGCARFLEKMDSLSDTMVGTPHYMCPELYGKQQYGRGADLWALGVMMYSLATLRMPFSSIAPAPGTDMDETTTAKEDEDDDEEESTAQRNARREQERKEKILAHNVRNADLEPIPKYLYPDEITSVIHGLLDKDPKKRPTTDDILDKPIFREFAIQSRLIRYFPHDMRVNPKGGSVLKHTPAGEECVFTAEDYTTLILFSDPIGYGVWRYTIKIKYANKGASTFRLGVLPMRTAALSDGTYIGHSSGVDGVCLLFEKKAKDTFQTALHGVPDLPDAARRMAPVPDGATVAVEVDVEEHTLCFFVNGLRLPHGVVGIKAPLHIGVSGLGKPSFTSVSYRRLMKKTGTGAVTLHRLVSAEPDENPLPSFLAASSSHFSLEDSLSSRGSGSSSRAGAGPSRLGTISEAAGDSYSTYSTTSISKTASKTSGGGGGGGGGGVGSPKALGKSVSKSQVKSPSKPQATSPAVASSPAPGHGPMAAAPFRSRVAKRQLELTDPKGQVRCFNDLCPYCAHPLPKIPLPPYSCRLDCSRCKVSFMLNPKNSQFEEVDFKFTPK